MKSRYWFLISLLLLGAAALCWQHGDRVRLRDQPRDVATNATAKPTVWERFTRLPGVLAGRTAPRDPVATAAPALPELLSLSRDPRLPFRLRNSQKPDAAFFRIETAVLLRNALVETQEPLEMKMPAHLRAGEEPGSWLVQARGTIDQGFRDVLRGAGAEIVSYVPNNAYLVRVPAAGAQRLAALGVREADLEESFVRSGGHGGQNVNKVSTCVMLLHRPTGLQVKCQDTRQQGLNLPSLEK